ncbi:hypothetical protein Sjap_021027 [Stephania japonica]|uniref:Uncharacterized protein n=1 Tax=Stephania japonica TaxID=461633 RepID=A0AAP0F716_9MAGN
MLIERSDRERSKSDRVRSLKGLIKQTKKLMSGRAREIAKDIAKRKMEKMKQIAKSKAEEEKRRLESESQTWSSGGANPYLNFFFEKLMSKFQIYRYT